MAVSPTQSILDQIRSLSPEEQLCVAEAVDKFTWAQRWRVICKRIAARVVAAGPIADDRIDAEVRTVRKEKPLSERSSIPPS